MKKMSKKMMAEMKMADMPKGKVMPFGKAKGKMPMKKKK